MNVELDDTSAYEKIALQWQLAEVFRLCEALESAGVPEAARRQICEDYFWGASMTFDSGRIVAEGAEFEPRVAFLSTDSPKLHVPNVEFAFHEYLHSLLAEVFGEDDDG